MAAGMTIPVGGLQRPGSAPNPITAAAPIPSVTAQSLLRGGRRLFIEHEGEVYTLQLTRQNKLLLTK